MSAEAALRELLTVLREVSYGMSTGMEQVVYRQQRHMPPAAWYDVPQLRLYTAIQSAERELEPDPWEGRGNPMNLGGL